MNGLGKYVQEVYAKHGIKSDYELMKKCSSILRSVFENFFIKPSCPFPIQVKAFGGFFVLRSIV